MNGNDALATERRRLFAIGGGHHNGLKHELGTLVVRAGLGEIANKLFDCAVTTQPQTVLVDHLLR